MFKKRIDLTGIRFGRLVVLCYAETKQGHAYWLCKCDCGQERVIARGSLRKGLSQSCGCLNREHTAQRNREVSKHGESNKTPEYLAWANMRKRCRSPTHKQYADYGGRGIDVEDPRWDEYPIFLADMGRKTSPAHSLDRIDNERGYYRENCRWATQSEQLLNRRPAKRKRGQGQ